jgi:hypothetical protein
VCDDVEWIILVQVMNKWTAAVRTVISLWSARKADNPLTMLATVSFYARRISVAQWGVCNRSVISARVTGCAGVQQQCRALGDSARGTCLSCDVTLFLPERIAELLTSDKSSSWRHLLIFCR